MKASRWLLLIAAVALIVGVVFNNIHKAKSDEDPGYRITFNFTDPQQGPVTMTYGDPQGPVFKTVPECEAFKSGSDEAWNRVRAMVLIKAQVRSIPPNAVKIECTSRLDLDEPHGGVKPSI